MLPGSVDITPHEQLHRTMATFKNTVSLLAWVVSFSVCAQQTTEWPLESATDFSLRCSKAARSVQIGGLTGRFIDQIYLHLSSGRLSRLRYSTSDDAPRQWYNSEQQVTYVDQRAGGRSQIEAQRRFRRLGGESYTSILIELDASKAQSDLDLLITDFVTLGKWEIQRKGLGVALKETTSILKDGKLQDASSDYWTSCRLMSPDGADTMR